MWRSVLWIIAFPLLAILLVSIVSAVLLGIGTALTLLFAVTVWEATVIVTVVAAGGIWLLYVGPFYGQTDEYPEEIFEDEEPPRIVVTDLPIRANRSRRRRRR
jgi:hypothetical protein